MRLKISKHPHPIAAPPQPPPVSEFPPVQVLGPKPHTILDASSSHLLYILLSASLTFCLHHLQHPPPPSVCHPLPFALCFVHITIITRWTQPELSLGRVWWAWTCTAWVCLLLTLPPVGTGAFLLLALLVGPPTRFPEASGVAHTGLVTGAPSTGLGEAPSPLGATREMRLP